MTRWLAVLCGSVLLGSLSCEQPTPECQGKATACENMGSTCLSQAGCSWLLRCEGGATCEAQGTEASCAAHSGCEWRRVCGGSAHPCKQQTTEEGCEQQSGCSWQ